mgnify:CR=1 FL=1
MSDMPDILEARDVLFDLLEVFDEVSKGESAPRGEFVAFQMRMYDRKKAAREMIDRLEMIGLEGRDE